MLDGCSTLDEVVATLQAAARAYKRLKAEGYELRGPIEDDYGFIRKVKKPEKKKMVINLSLKSRAAAAAAVKEEEEEEGEPKKKLMLVPKKKPEKIPEKKVVAVKKQIDGKAKLLKKLQGFR